MLIPQPATRGRRCDVKSFFPDNHRVDKVIYFGFSFVIVKIDDDDEDKRGTKMCFGVRSKLAEWF